MLGNDPARSCSAAANRNTYQTQFANRGLSRNNGADGRGARSSRPLPSASRRRAASTRPKARNDERNLMHHLFGETPNRTTGTVALQDASRERPAVGALASISTVVCLLVALRS